MKSILSDNDRPISSESTELLESLLSWAEPKTPQSLVSFAKYLSKSMYTCRLYSKMT